MQTIIYKFMEALKAWENLISSPFDQKLNTKYKMMFENTIMMGKDVS